MFSILPRGMLANLVAVAILFSLIANFAMSAPMASIGLGAVKGDIHNIDDFHRAG